MGADEIVRAADRPHAPHMRSVAARFADERWFWLGLACAAALHLGMIFGVSRSLPRIMGEPDGSFDGISVDLVDAADFASKTTVPPDKSPVDSGNAAQPPRPPAEAARPSPPAPAQQKATASSLEEQTPDLFALPDVTGKQSGKEAPNSRSKSASQTDLSPPSSMPDMSVAPLGRSAAVGRPPGITRSGENDDFGRGVIRALRQTMPAPRGILGRVTVRLFLSETGNLAEVRVVRSSGDPILDQSVMFASKQSSFPIPPAGSTLSDRTFLVTYIYN